MAEIEVSVVIPVKNGAETLKKCLDGIFSQSVGGQLEVIIIDSGSTDDSLRIISEFPVVLKQIPPSDFNHGATRNLGAQMARGKYIVMTVQDAIPADKGWLSRMIRHFEDPAVAGVCGQQIVPHERDKNPHEWFRPVNGPALRAFQFLEWEKFESLTSSERRMICGWDDVNACYRAEVLKGRLPFSPVAFGEDLDWAIRAYREGYKLVFDTSCRVYHYHHSSYARHYDRIMEELTVDYKYFGMLPALSFPWSMFLKVVYRNFKYRVSLSWIWYNWKLIWAERQAALDFTRAASGFSARERR